MPRMPPGGADHAVLPALRRESRRVLQAFTTPGRERLMAVQAQFCGRCGSQLLRGAVYCGRCGTPQVVTAVAAPPMAPPAAYGYRVAQPGAFPAAGRVKVPQVIVVVGLLLILAIAIVAI